MMTQIENFLFKAQTTNHLTEEAGKVQLSLNKSDSNELIWQLSLSFYSHIAYEKRQVKKDAKHLVKQNLEIKEVIRFSD